jgi:peptidoglycan/xylan/chitin deacetylase (PgdA/CDA1 family)
VHFHNCQLTTMVTAIRKKIDRSVANTVLERLVSVLEGIDRRANVLRVLTYHRIADASDRPDLCPQLISATPFEFERQMAYIASHYHAVSLPEALDAFTRRRPLPRRAVMITFDDAYQDFADNAWPILRRHGLPATLFVATAFAADPSRAFWWDRLYNAVRLGGVQAPATRPGLVAGADPAVQRTRTFRYLAAKIKSLPHQRAMRLVDRLCAQAPAPQPAVLGWSELQALSRVGVSLGAHTRTHPLMHRLPADEAAAQAVGSLADLRTHVGPTAPVFAFPGGKSTPQIRQKLYEAGFSLAFTTQRGVNAVSRANPMALKRIHVAMSNCNAIFRGRLLSYWPHLRSLAFG